MGKRTSQLGEITTIDDNDILYGVDVDDLTHSPDGTSVKFKKSNLLKEVNSRVGDIESDVSELQGVISGLLDWFYPVGTIYHTTSTDLDTPAKMNAHFGGTWEVYGSGRVLVGKANSGTFATVGATMGEETHTLTANESGLRSHRHQLRLGTPLGIGAYNDKVGRVAEGTTSDDEFRTGLAYAPTSPYGVNGYGGSSLDNAPALSPHNNIQPSIVVYRYRRIA